jgi:hypothetical protein
MGARLPLFRSVYSDTLSYDSSVFEVITSQDYTVTIRPEAEEPSPQLSTWKTLNNEEWARIYSTPWVPGYGDLLLVVDKMSFDIVVQQNRPERATSGMCNMSKAEILAGRRKEEPRP